MKKNILVTGGCGFIGANLIPKLIEREYQIRVVDNLSRGSLDFIAGLDVDFHRGDICDAGDMKKAMTGVDGVIHLAAYGSVIESLEDPITNFKINAGSSPWIWFGLCNWCSGHSIDFR